MRAAVVHRYGPPEDVDIAEVASPPPGRGEVLVRVEAAAVTSGDARMRAGRFPAGFGLLARLGIGLRGPRRQVLGACFSGEVTRVGDGVEGVGVGDRVAGMSGTRLGAHAEYLTVPAVRVVPTPDGVAHADAAGALFGGTTALYFLRDRAHLQAGQSVLVNGASGSVGGAAVQLATLMGADVTAVASGPNAAVVTAWGADRVVDYTRTPVSQLTGTYDVVVDAVGTITREEGLRLSAPDGSVILAVAGLWDTVRARGRVIAGAAPERREDFAYLLGLVADGRFDAATEVLGGLDALPEAYRRVDSGRKVGNVVIVPAHGPR